MSPQPKPAGALTAYVYFRSGRDDAERVRTTLARQRTLVEERLGLRCRVGVRHDENKPYLTWLEVYEGIDPAALQATLLAIDRASTDSGLAALAPEGRRNEVFGPADAG